MWLVESFLYGVYAGIMFVPIYNAPLHDRKFDDLASALVPYEWLGVFIVNVDKVANCLFEFEAPSLLGTATDAPPPSPRDRSWRDRQCTPTSRQDPDMSRR